jgi:hypothetical protein
MPDNRALDVAELLSRNAALGRVLNLSFASALISMSVISHSWPIVPIAERSANKAGPFRPAGCRRPSRKSRPTGRNDQLTARVATTARIRPWRGTPLSTLTPDSNPEGSPYGELNSTEMELLKRMYKEGSSRGNQARKLIDG